MITGELGDRVLEHLQQIRRKYTGVGTFAEYWALTMAIDAVIGLPEEGFMEDVKRLCEACEEVPNEQLS